MTSQVHNNEANYKSLLTLKRFDSMTSLKRAHFTLAYTLKLLETATETLDPEALKFTLLVDMSKYFLAYVIDICFLTCNKIKQSL